MGCMKIMHIIPTRAKMSTASKIIRRRTRLPAWLLCSTTMQRLRDAFKAFDTDESGTITADELKGILTRKSSGQPLSAMDADDLVAQFDANGDNVLQLDEFIRALESLGWDAATPISDMMHVSSNLKQLQASWDIFASALPGKSLQDTSDREPASGATFTPAMQKNFSVHLLGSVARPTIDARKIEAALRSFAASVGVSAGSSGQLEQLLAVLTQAGTDEGKILTALVHIYTMQTFFYSELNRALRDDIESRLQTLVPVIPCLVMSLRVHPFSGTVWRGFPVADLGEAEAYRKGLVFFWPGFCSCSANSSVSKSYAGGNMNGHSLLFQITINADDAGCAADIASASYFKSEAEVLLAPYTCLTVLGTSQAGPQQTLIECAATSTLQNLTGIWSCVEDGGTYYVSQVNKHVVWFGTGPSWGHVFLGSIRGRTLVGTFADLPTAEWRYDGDLALEISDASSTMRRIPERSPAFLGSTFRRIKGHTDTADAPTLTCMSAPTDGAEERTGEWHSDKGLVYFVRHLPSKGQLFWFAYARSWASLPSSEAWSAANVFGGVWDETAKAYIGVYSDVVLSTRFRYSGKLKVTFQPSSGPIYIHPLEGAYACTELWTQGI